MCAKRKKQEEQKKLIFSNEFFSDMESDNMLYAVLIRSPVADAHLNSISHPHLPEGYFIFDANDISGKKTIQTLGLEIPVFSTGEIRYIGEPLGILVGKDEKKLRELLNSVEIRYEEHLNDSTELLAERTVSTSVRIDQFFDEAAFTVEGTWISHIHPKNYSEPNGAFCYLKDDMMHIFTPSQWLSHMRLSISEVTGIDKNNIVITRTQFSELDTNILWVDSQLAAQVCIAVLKTKKPVKLVLTREEQQQFIENAAPVSISHKTALNTSGEIIADDITITVDGGAYNPFAREFIDRLCIASCNIYSPKAVRINGKVYRSAYPPYSVDLSTIDSHAIYAMESQLQKIAEKTGFDPMELRTRNYAPSGKKKNTMPFQLNCENVMETMQAICRSSDFNRKYITYRLNEENRYLQNNNSPFAPPLRGMGFACGFSGSGYNGTSFIKSTPSLEITLETDGTLHIHALPTSLSVWNIWKSIAANTLVINEKSIVLNSEFTIEKEPEAPETISSNISIMTQLLKKACDSMRRKKDTDALPLTIKKTVPPSKKKMWNKDRFSGIPFMSTAFAACTVEVELDSCTYREHIRSIWIVVDAGKILSAKAAEATIKSTVQQTLHELFADDVVHCPNIRVQFLQSASEPKQIDGIVYSLLPAAFAAALSQALAITVTRLPVQSDTLYKLTKKAKRLFDEQREAEQKAKEEKSAEEKPAGQTEELATSEESTQEANA
ncbi:MAG: xanthine dehydrogenase family protein [Treponema sp.]|nr:xanthine dehydrogenase family protein [Treponema sp.]